MSLHSEKRYLTFVLCSRICSWDYNLLSQASQSLGEVLKVLMKNRTSIVFFQKTNHEKTITNTLNFVRFERTL